MMPKSNGPRKKSGKIVTMSICKTKTFTTEDTEGHAGN
jgi:hypothetical protein